MTASVPITFPEPEAADNVRYNPDFDELRAFSSPLETTTEFGSPSYVSRVKSRSADRTSNTVETPLTSDDREHLQRAVAALSTTEIVCVDRMLGRHPEYSYCCRLYVPKAYARIALSWATLLEPAPAGRKPDFQTVQLPEWDGTLIRVLPETGTTFVLGSDYTGEAKKSFLRMYMYELKRAGGLGLHAGTKRVTVKAADGGLVDRCQVFLGLSATGKTTLTGHGFWLDPPETAHMLQDDVCGLLPDGSVVGSEGHGLYIKTYELDADEQPAMYHAATQPTAVLENVAVDGDGSIDFYDDRHTKNGRASVTRDDLPSADDAIDCERADQIFFITRHPIMPPIIRLSPAEAAAAFMLGESIETSAGDPSRAGESVRVVGTNPFIIGPPAEEGNRFLELVERNDIDCFVLNTGHVGLGERRRSIGVADTVAILTAIARETVEWHDHPIAGWSVPSSIPGLDIDRFAVEDRWEDFEAELAAVRTDRRDYLARYEGLSPAIGDAVY